jgi:uncharacterized protein
MSTVDPQIAATRDWVERIVVGLNLCPFAKPVLAADRIRFVVTNTHSKDALRAALEDELRTLHAADPNAIETTLLIHPNVLGDFLDYNDFLDVADAAVAALDLEGIIQIASFHPNYQFADAARDAVENYTNRSPFPMLHLLREESVERAHRLDIALVDRVRIRKRIDRALGIAGLRRLRG